jgi:hypothetical protein
MKKMLLRGLAIFAVLLTFTTIFGDLGKIQFGLVNYWNKHGVFLLIFLTIFPRLTLLFSSIPFGGFFWWMGLLFVPRVLVAILATLGYFKTNPFLVTMSWLIALGGEFFEKYGLGRNRSRFHFQIFQMGSHSRSSDSYDSTTSNATTLKHDNVIEAEYTKKD